MSKVNIVLNGKPIKVNSNEYIIDVAKREGISIPTLCNDDRLEPFSSCYVCVVEIQGIKKPQPSCSTKVAEGMVIYTDSEKVYKARQTALNLLLSNHYADCVAPCKETCPAGVDVQGYISLIEKRLYSEAVALIKEVNPLPAICGRVCVRPCELACRRNLVNEGNAVGIDYLKRFASDYDLNSVEKFIPKKEKPTGKKVAIIGAGPGGLSAAYYLQLKGHQCDIFEAQKHPGGWLRYGIPEYRLPNDILDAEVKNITDLGVNIFYNQKLGENLKYSEIAKKYHTCILTIGSQRGTLLGCRDEDAEGVFSGIDFLRNMEVTGQKYDFTNKKIIVVGGGNTAMDCCRSAIRLGSTDVKLVYRRSEAEMPANPIEIHESKLEGVEYLFLHNPVQVNKDENGKIKSVRLIKMGLGEADASGRRRPIPIEGSEYDLEADYILAAIGQKTDINFLDDINSTVKIGELKANKWGDIDADPKTLQTGVPSIFAAGDGVTGPATLIEAIAQAGIAWKSCHQYLIGEEIKPKIEVFKSKKDNFKQQESQDYLGRYKQQLRQEMPVLDPKDRYNYNEVELGYENEDVALNETSRCFECGCSEFFDCKLQQYADEYEVNQKIYAGDFNSYQIDFSHPLIEIDNNKCILCSKCIRVCEELVGAKALGLVKRGFETFVAPSMLKSLTQTNCESCGMCISLCPTGAITENVPFKILPLKPDKFETIDCFTSEGANIELFHRKNFIYRADGSKGIANKNANIGSKAKFGYRIFNDVNRITKPLYKINGQWQEISFNEAFKLIKKNISGNEDKTISFASGRYSNEELYLIQKFVRTALKTNNINSLNYLNRGIGYTYASNNNTPLDEIKSCGKIYIIGSNLNYSNSLINHAVFNAQYRYNSEIILITENKNSPIAYKCDKIIETKSIYNFFKAINKIVVDEVLFNKFYLESKSIDYSEYFNKIEEIELEKLAQACNISISDLKNIANEYNNEQKAVIIFSEDETESTTVLEIQNLSILTGKTGKTASGIICIKEKNNSQGLIDMGLRPNLRPGAISTSDACLCENILEAKFENFLIFGEDPIGQSIDNSITDKWFANKKFMLVQDYFMTKTAEIADLILPASFHFETGGSFTNTQKAILNFEKTLDSKIELNNLQQFKQLFNNFGIEQETDLASLASEIFDIIAEAKLPQAKLIFTDCNNENRYFKNSCDIVFEKLNDIFNF